MKSRASGGGGEMFKSSGISSQSVELPPISKTGLILEDADDVEYSVSAKGSSRSGRKPLHSNSTEPVSAPRIASSTRNLVASSWNVSDQNLAKQKTPHHRQNRYVESLPLDRRKSSIDRCPRPGSYGKQLETKPPATNQEQGSLSKGTEKIAAKKSPRSPAVSAKTKSAFTDYSKEVSSIAESSNTKNVAVNIHKGAQSLRSEKSIATESSNGSSANDRRNFTASRRKKVEQNDDFVVELFLKDEPPSKTIIDETFIQDQTNGSIPTAHEKGTANVEETSSTGKLTVESVSAVPEKEVDSANLSNDAIDKLNGAATSESETANANMLNGYSVVENKEVVPNEPGVNIVPATVDRSASKFHDDVITPPEDVFVTGSNLRSPKYESTPISVQEAISLKKALFGDVRAAWSKAWLNHSLNMSGSFSIDLCHFAPSGILAALQAHYIQHHFFGNEKDESSIWKPTQSRKRANLTRAISSLLWKCGSDNSLACFCNISFHVQYSSSTAMPHDGVTERVEIFRFSSENEISQFMSEFANQIISSKCALLILLYSVVLSRSAYSIRQDLLNQEEPLLLNYRCSPALISLLLTGVAAPCWMNDNSDLRLDPRFRRGVNSRSNFGLLTTRKTQSTSYVIDSNLKTPKLPIWIVEIPSGDMYSSKRHFQYSVLFCSDKRLVSDWKVERHFDLHWTQACPYQVERVKFTLDARCVVNWDEFCEEDYHLVETAIRTKWVDVDVDWNGSNRCDFGFVPPSETAVQVFKR